MIGRHLDSAAELKNKQHSRVARDGSDSTGCRGRRLAGARHLAGAGVENPILGTIETLITIRFPLASLDPVGKLKMRGTKSNGSARLRKSEAEKTAMMLEVAQCL